MSFAENLKRARDRMGLTQQQVANRLEITNSTYCGYETGKRKPNPERIKALAQILNTPADILLGTQAYAQNTAPPSASVLRPRLGSIACGQPILAEQNIEGYDSVPDWVKCDFTLLCRGDSMTGARIFDGDLVCIRQQPAVENGQIAAVLIEDGGDGAATLKRVRILSGGIALMPENPAYEPMIFMGEDANRVRVLGLATHFISTIR